MRIFVTGATGVVGRRVVPVLVGGGHHVTVAGRPSPRLEALARAGAATAAVDIFDARAVRRTMQGHEVVLNLATHVPRGLRMFLPGGWREMDRVRRDAATIIARSAAELGVARLVQESFAPIYPDRGAQWIDESVAPTPARYNRSVLDAERAAQEFGTLGTAVVLRFALFYGPDDDFTTQLLGSARTGWLPLVGAPDGYVPMVSHDDAAAAVLAALALPGGIYNVVDDEPMTRRAIAETIGTVHGTRPPKLPPPLVRRLMGSLGETLARSQRVSNATLRARSSWRPAWPSLREGFAALAASPASAAPSR